MEWATLCIYIFKIEKLIKSSQNMNMSYTFQNYPRIISLKKNIYWFGNILATATMECGISNLKKIKSKKSSI